MPREGERRKRGESEYVQRAEEKEWTLMNNDQDTRRLDNAPTTDLSDRSYSLTHPTDGRWHHRRQRGGPRADAYTARRRGNGSRSDADLQVKADLGGRSVGRSVGTSGRYSDRGVVSVSTINQTSLGGGARIASSDDGIPRYCRGAVRWKKSRSRRLRHRFLRAARGFTRQPYIYIYI